MITKKFEALERLTWRRGFLWGYIAGASMGILIYVLLDLLGR